MRKVGRYLLHDPIASGGMGTVHLGCLVGSQGFARPVAIKRMRRDLTEDARLARMFLDEARLAGRVHHPNVVSTLDVFELHGELFLVLELVHGESLSRIRAASTEPIPVDVALGIASGFLTGLHAAHEAVDEERNPLEMVHRDVSPQNVLVGDDGVARITDFGIAKATGRLQTTAEGQLKGKLGYMAPEQIRGMELDRRTDVYAAAVVVWEMLANQRLFEGNEASILYDILEAKIAPPSSRNPLVPEALDAPVLRALARDRADRFETATAFAEALEGAHALATQRRVGAWLTAIIGPTLEARRKLLADLERAEDVAPLSLPEGRRSAAGPRVPGEAQPDPGAEAPTRIVGPGEDSRDGTRHLPTDPTPTRGGTEIVPMPGPLSVSAPSVRRGPPRRSPALWIAPLAIGAVAAAVYLSRAPSATPPPQASAGSSPSVDAARLLEADRTAAVASQSTAAPAPSVVLSTVASVSAAPSSSAPAVPVAVGPPPLGQRASQEVQRLMATGDRCRDGKVFGVSQWVVTFAPSGQALATHVLGETTPCITGVMMGVRNIGPFAGRTAEYTANVRVWPNEFP